MISQSGLNCGYSVGPFLKVRFQGKRGVDWPQTEPNCWCFRSPFQNGQPQPTVYNSLLCLHYPFKTKLRVLPELNWHLSAIQKVDRCVIFWTTDSWISYWSRYHIDYLANTAPWKWEKRSECDRKTENEIFSPLQYWRLYRRIINI